jgi:sugar/nucleoside kinase (ribokinase family)
VEILTLIGDDPHGDVLMTKWQEMDIGVKYVERQKGCNSALSVLPVYKTGKRAIYFCSGTNLIMNVDHILLGTGNNQDLLRQVKVFHYGYPHLSPMIQNNELERLFQYVRGTYNVITSLDVNGADSNFSVFESSLQHVDVFHANIEEALTICGKLDQILVRFRSEQEKSEDKHALAIEDVVTMDDVTEVAHEILSKGSVIVTITLGARGVYTVVTTDEAKLSSFFQHASIRDLSSGYSLYLPSFKLLPTKGSNTTGAGDSFVGGLLASIASEIVNEINLEEIIKVAQLTALHRLSGIPDKLTVKKLVDDIRSNKFETLPSAF